MLTLSTSFKPFSLIAFRFKGKKFKAPENLSYDELEFCSLFVLIKFSPLDTCSTTTLAAKDRRFKVYKHNNQALASFSTLLHSSRSSSC